METIRGSLEDSSRPASCEETSSRVSRRCPAAGVQIQRSSEETTTSSSACGPGQGQCHSDVTDAGMEDSELQRAIKEMRRLDEILSAKICREVEVKRQRKELQAKLWQDLLNKPEGYSECAHEALNTKLFLALEAGRGKEEEEEKEDYYVSVFETQVPDSDCDGQRLEQSDKKPDNSTDSSETWEEQCEDSHCGASRGKKKQRDFVKRNIELAVGDGDLLTQAEKQRLAELLQQIDEEEDDGARGTDSEEDKWAVSVLTGQGYTPVPSDLEQLIDIDSKMRLLLPVEEFVSVQSSYTNINVSQGRGSEVGWKCNWDPQPGEKVLQDRKERRGLERQLQEIQQQLEILGRSPEMTNESPDLTEEELLSLLDECELTESWIQELETTDTTR
ncbi:fibrous sheath-interacting protein 1 isoform X2 [Paralichthys olivaceus]|uniref:fibrous sheath-interacting protein 1 isoform X2 n=1 Tax=Paralichthys olivaceus TaxID=8255 RepID=UPI003750C06F